jgi:hypothetical protein
VSESTQTIETFANQEYKWGFVTDIAADTIPRGLNEDVIRLISAKKEEPEWLLEWRLKAYRHWLTLKEPTWANVHYPKIDYNDIIYYSSPKARKDGPKSLDEVDPELLKTYAKLGIPLQEQAILAGVAVDAVFDSVSVATTFKSKLMDLGIIFGSFSEAVREHPDLVRKYLGSVVPASDNFFAALNSAVFSDGSFCYIPKGVRCPMELSTYFRINAKDTGQFERTLIVADEGAYVSYLEGCTAPMRDTNQLHAAVVELVALDNAQGEFEDFVDAGGDRLGHYVEISELPADRRQLRGRVLLRGADQQLAAGRHRHEDDPHWEEHHFHYRVEGHFRRPRTEYLSRRRQNSEIGHGRAQLLAVRFHAAGRPMRRAHVPVPGSEEYLVAGGARGVDVEDRRRPDFLLQAARHFV